MGDGMRPRVTTLHEDAKMAIYRAVSFPPGIDVMRDYHVQRAADAVLKEVQTRVRAMQRADHTQHGAGWDDAIAAVAEMLEP